MSQVNGMFEQPEARPFNEFRTLAWSTSIGFAGWSVFLETVAFLQNHYRFPAHPTETRLILVGLWLPLVIMLLISVVRTVRAGARK
jgi:hypothetical protein